MITNQPSPSQYRHAIAILEGCVRGIKERYEQEDDGHEGIIRFLDKTLNTAEDVLKEGGEDEH